jgi:hypothetical protein
MKLLGVRVEREGDRIRVVAELENGIKQEAHNFVPLVPLVVSCS